MIRQFICSLVALVISVAAPLRAETLPALYRVEGVAADDVLNIRVAPGAGAAILGTIAPGTAGVEVIRLSESGTWGQVGTAEGNGWVAMRYLRPLTASTRASPHPFLCHGTEPFWSLNSGEGIGTQTGTWATPEEPSKSLAVISLLDLSVPPFASSGGDPGWFAALFGRDTSGSAEIFSLTVTRRACSDGMSDRIFGFEALVLRQSGGEVRAFQGCCTLDQR